MTRVPYNIDEAKAKRDALQHLIGREFSPQYPHAGPVEAVIITPFDQHSKKLFFTTYLLTEDAELCLSQYRGLLHDVEVLARNGEDPNDILHCDIETWLHKNNLRWEDLCGGAQSCNRSWQSL